MPTTAPYGTWTSPITSEWLTLSQKRFGTMVLDGDTIYWDELRPNENGRYVVVQLSPTGEKQDVTPENFSARTRVHEYGGAPYTVHEGKVYFVNDKDQRIYLGTEPLTELGIRFADLHVYDHYLIAVGEKNHDNFLICLDLKTKKWTKIASGNDFYASPAFNNDGSQLAFLTWNHPQMPWDGAELMLADFKHGKLSNIRKIAGSPSESIFQPSWSPSDVLHYVSDRTGWRNLYRFSGKPEQLCPRESEFGLPQWVFGMSTYAFTGEKILATFVKDGRWSLGISPDFKPLDLPWTYFTQIRANAKFAIFLAGSYFEDKSIYKYDFAKKKTTLLVHNVHPHLDKEYISEGQFLSYPSAKGRIAHAFYYPPKNKDFVAPEGTFPPLVVMSHGGPTTATNPTFDLKIQYWTSRGIAVLDVDYGGSTGYGRLYADALKNNWGIVDVEDCEAGALYLVDQKKADPKKLAIRGGSAGGYTTLAALTFGKTFTVGASYYGVSDLTALAEETHKFEARYLDTLVGPYPSQKKLYEERSPLFNVDKLKCPVIFFQGSEDLIVPLNQAEKMYEALKKRGIMTELVVYEGEQHGFRKAQNIRDSLEKELAFYLKSWNQ
jgi:dipeptidyl aminopeptidase/acylaminoacyl peptidase